MDKLSNQTHRGSNISELLEEEGFHWSISPLTRKGRTNLYLGLLILPLISGAAVLIYTSVQLSQSVYSYRLSEDLVKDTEAAIESLKLVTAIQDYTAVSSVYKTTNYTGMFGPLRSFFLRVSDQATQVLSWYGSSENGADNLNELLKPFNQDGEEFQQSDLPGTAYEYCLTVQWSLIHSITYYLMENKFGAWGIKSLFIEVTQSYVSLGIEKGLTVFHFLLGNLTSEEYLMMVEHMAIHREHLDFALLQSDSVDIEYNQEIDRYPNLIPGINEARNIVTNSMQEEERLYQGMVVHNKYSILQITLENILQNLFEDIKQLASDEKQTSIDILVYSVFKIIAILFILIPFVIISARQNFKSLLVYTITMERNNLQLKKEKRKIDEILNQMLPKAVAYKLRRGETVSAEEYEQATIFFSDIDNFDDISSHSSPMQIVNFLNDIYNFMDNQLERYDVYKVETIGCVYMVVSGLPMRNGNRHVSEIARMALDLMYTTQNFVIAHLPESDLLMRIGIHSGPVVAGVIGNITPRYCLFGDSVNTASRMQSNGLAQKIHISEQCRTALDKIGGFIYEERGKVEIKGKGMLTTYWLKARIEPQQ